MADYMTTDPYAEPRRRRTTTPYIPASVSNPADTGIPTQPATADTGIPQTASAAPTRYQSIVDAYNTYLGRTPSQDEVNSQVGGGSWAENDPRIQSSISNIMNSPEAAAYAGGKPWNAPGGYAATPAPAPAAPATTAMSGWDQTKWADASHTTPKYVVGRILSQYAPGTAGLQSALPAIQQAFPGATLVGTDKLNIPGVGLVDVGGNFNDSVQGNENWWWGADGGGTAAPAATGTPAATGATAGASAGGGGAAAGGGAFGDQIKAMILKLMNQQPTDMASDPVYGGAMDAYRTEQQRAMETERNAIAERMNAEGTLNTGGFSDRVLGAEQQAGENTASFAGQLGVRELERQRNEIMQALQLGAGVMTDEQRIALTEKLGLIDANLRQQSITNQANQFDSSLGWDMAQYGYGANSYPWSAIFGA